MRLIFRKVVLFLLVITSSLGHMLLLSSYEQLHSSYLRAFFAKVTIFLFVYRVAGTRPLVERVKRVIESMLAKQSEPLQHSDWTMLVKVEYAINNSVYSSTQQTPCMLLGCRIT